MGGHRVAEGLVKLSAKRSELAAKSGLFFCALRQMAV